MVLERFKSYLVGLKEIGGLSIRIIDPETWSISVCLIKIRKGLVEIEKCQDTISNLSDLGSIIDKNIPISLTIDGKGVLHKVMPANDSSPEKLSSVLPGMEINDFVIQTVEDNENRVSLLRKEVVEDILDQLKRLEFQVVRVSFGPFDLDTLMPLVKNPEGHRQFSWSGYQLQFDEQNIITTFHPDKEEPVTDPEPIYVDELAVDNRFILPFASAFCYVIGQKESNLSGLDVERLSEEWEFKMIFKKVSMVVTLLIFAVLILNVILNIQLSGTNEELNYQYNLGGRMLTRLKDLESKLADQEAVFSGVTWSERGRMAFYLDRIAATVPAEIRLSQLTIFPLDNPNKTLGQNEAMFKQGIIEFRGKCENPIILNEWLEVLEGLDWVNAINKERFYLNTGDKTGEFFFELLIEQ